MRWEEALRLQQELVHQLFTPDVVSWSAASSACENSKRWEEALRMLQNMVRHALAPNPLSWSGAKQWEEALRLLQKVVHLFLTPNTLFLFISTTLLLAVLKVLPPF